MPGLVLFRRRWTIGSDDFVFPSIGEAFLRVSWLLAVAIIYAVHQGGFACAHGHQLKAFYIGTLVLNSIGIVNVLALLWISMKGTIRDSWPRRHIGWCLYIKLFLLLPEAVWVCLSTYWIFGHSYECNWTVVWTAKGTVICSWTVGLIMFIGIIAVFDPMGSLEHRRAVSCRMSKSGDSGITVSNLTSSSVWERRCHLLCCCLMCNQDTRQALTDVGKLVAEFFHDLDLVPTDIAAGLMLVQEQQMDSDARLTAVVSADRQRPDSVLQAEADNAVPQPKNWMTISNMAHYMKYAMGSYGWPFYIYENLATGLCKICSQCRCCACIRKPNGVFKDNICQCNTAAIKKLSGVTDDDLIYVTFHNQFKQVPFYVVVDRAKNSVVVSIRGTMSLTDALADLTASGASLDIPGVPNSYCHGAMLDCAKYIQSELEYHHVLQTAFAHLTEGAHLVLTGHSLGAGVAAILAVLIRPHYPDLTCFSYSPPGGLMSPNASKYTQDFVCSVVVGKDLVPRLGMSTLIDLKVKLLRALCTSNKPKYKILASGCLRLMCCMGPPSDESTSPGTYYTEDRTPILQAQAFQDSLHLAETQLHEVVNTKWPLHPAGQILHIVGVDEDSPSCCNDPQYCAYWSRAECFDKIVISHKMVSDHIPNAVGFALDQLYDRNYVPYFQQMTPRQHLQHC